MTDKINGQGFRPTDTAGTRRTDARSRRAAGSTAPTAAADELGGSRRHGEHHAVGLADEQARGARAAPAGRRCRIASARSRKPSLPARTTSTTKRVADQHDPVRSGAGRLTAARHSRTRNALSAVLDEQIRCARSHAERARPRERGARRRRSRTADCGRRPTRRGSSTALERLESSGAASRDGDDAARRRGWQRCSSSIASCKEQNQRNGALLKARSEQVRDRAERAARLGTRVLRLRAASSPRRAARARSARRERKRRQTHVGCKQTF